MNDYFDELEIGLKDAVRRRAHVPWYVRLTELSARHRGVAALVAAFVIATPSVAAVGAVAGWFGTGKPDLYAPASATSGLGKALTKNGRLLPIRVTDPDGGPPWGVRLVETNRGKACIQVGRVVDGQIGSLGIDSAWHNDHKFHEIEPNDQRADICGATDGDGIGFVSDAAFGAPASVDVPLDNSGTPGRCSNPLAPHKRGEGPSCPASAMRVIYAGLLGPDAKSVTYETMTGRKGVEKTTGGVGAYLFVFRETGHNCGEPDGLTILDARCPSGEPGPSIDLQAPTAITSVTYRNGRTCGDQPSASFVTAYKSLVTRIHRLSSGQLKREYPAMWTRFLARQHLNEDNWLLAARPECQPVGWVAAKLPKLATAQGAGPIRVTLRWQTRFCTPNRSPDDGIVVVPCSRHVPGGLYVAPKAGSAKGRYLVVTVSFAAPEAVRTDNDSYQVDVETATHSGGYGAGTGYDIRRGQRVTLSFVGFALKGRYSGTVNFAQDTDQNGPGQDGMEKLVIGRFSFKVP
jgi:hypothetical protein